MIPNSLYHKIMGLLPIPCVDMFIEYDEGYIWIKRNIEPEKGEWATVGGRVQLNEKLEDACRRIARKELGIENITLKRQLGTMGSFYNDRHCISTFFLAKTKDEIKVNKEEVQDYKISREPPEGTANFYMKFLKRYKI